MKDPLSKDNSPGSPSLLGRSIARTDSFEKARGRAIFASDMKLPRMLKGKILRSPLSHARIVNIDISKAKQVRGVRVVIHAHDTPGKKAGPIIMDETILAMDKVRFVGEEVAAIAAEDEAAAEEAIERIEVDYQELPAIYDPELALDFKAADIHDNGNLAAHQSYERGNLELGFRISDEIFESRYETQAQCHSYLEPRACLAAPDGAEGIIVWGGFQSIYYIRGQLARLLDIKESQVRVVQTYMGGGYGGKIALPEAAIAALLAMKTKRPIQLVNSREEEFRATRPRAPGVIEQKIGVKKDGTLIARQVRVVTNCGAYAGWGPGIAKTMAIYPENIYRFSHLKGECLAVYTNNNPIGPMRGFGSPEGHFALETQLDQIAHDLGIDPLEIRLKNSVDAGELTVHGWRIGSCGLKNCLKEVIEKSDWKNKKAKRKTDYGLGLACGIHVSGARQISDYDGSTAFVKVDPDGWVTVITGEADIGQGAWTVLRQIAAEEIGAHIQHVRVLGGDTDIAPFCLGAYAARVTVAGGNAVRLAAADAKHQMLRIASELLEANPADLEVKESQVYVRGAPSRAISFGDIGQAAVYRKGKTPVLGQGKYDPPHEGQDKETLYGNFSPCYPFCAEVAEVEADRKTGQVKVLSFAIVDDIGRVINPMIAEGQMQGCISIGFGLAMTEEMVWDKGNLTNGSFADYRIPVASDLPAINSSTVETIDQQGPFGAKSASEISICAVPAAINNAIFDAVGVRIRSLPITPEKLLKALSSTET